MSKFQLIESDEGSWFESWRGQYIPANVILYAWNHGFHDDEIDAIVDKHYPNGIIKYDEDDVEQEIADLEGYYEIYEDAESYLNDIADMPDGYYLGFHPDIGDWGFWKDDNDD